MGISFMTSYRDLQELLEGKAITSIQKVSDEVAKKHKLRLYPKGTILFAKSGMSCIKGYIYVLPQSAYVVSHLACITPNEDISEYLRYYFNYHKPNQLPLYGIIKSKENINKLLELKKRILTNLELNQHQKKKEKISAFLVL